VSLWGRRELITGSMRGLLMFLLGAGVAGGVYEVGLLRIYPVRTEAAPDADYPYLATDHEFGRRTYAARQVYEQLRRTLPEGAVLQHNPDLELGSVPYGLYADRQMAAESTDCGTVLGGDAKVCEGMHPLVSALFHPPAGKAQPEVDAVCRQFGINVLVVRDNDPVWADRQSWVWTRRPLAANAMVRALPCGQ